MQTNLAILVHECMKKKQPNPPRRSFALKIACPQTWISPNGCVLVWLMLQVYMAEAVGGMSFEGVPRLAAGESSRSL